MARNGSPKGNAQSNSESRVSERTLRDFAKDLRIAQDAVRKAQDENRSLGIPNWYQINGEIVSDIQMAERKNGKM